MSANSNRKKPVVEQEVDVLYQKLGERWFAFSIINDEVFMSPITEEKIAEIRSENQNSVTNNSVDHEAA